MRSMDGDIARVCWFSRAACCSHWVFKLTIRLPHTHTHLCTCLYHIWLAAAFFTIMLSTMLFFFMAYHLFLVARNTTTNETFKWKDAAAFQSDCKKAIADPNFTTRSWKKIEVTDTVREWATRALVNIYHRGIVQNFKEVLFPSSQSF